MDRIYKSILHDDDIDNTNSKGERIVQTIFQRSESLFLRRGLQSIKLPSAYTYQKYSQTILG
jgi:hypothetical protein